MHHILYSSWWEACLLTFLLWEILRAPKSLNNDDVGEFTGSIYEEELFIFLKAVNLRGVIWTISNTWVLNSIWQEHLTMSAVTEIFGTIIKETGRTAAGSHPLKRATGASASHSRYSCIYMVQLQHAVPDSITVTTLFNPIYWQYGPSVPAS